MSFLDKDLPANRAPIVRLKRRTIVVYLNYQGRQCATEPLMNEDIYLFTEHLQKHRGSLLYLVRCSPRKRK